MDEFNEHIKKCETLKQIFDVVNKHYDTTEQLPLFSGAIIKNKIPGLVKKLKLKKKDEIN